MDDPDRQMLAFAGAHPFVLRTQAERLPTLADTDMKAIVCRLSDQRLLHEEHVLPGHEPLLRITNAGLSAIGSRLEPPKFAFNDLRHEIAAVSLWARAWNGAFGPPSRVLSRREMIGIDHAAVKSSGAASRYGLRLAGGIHYPDTALVTNGHRIAFELRLWPGRSFDSDELFAAYRDQLHVDAVVVLVETESVRRAMRAAAARAEIADRAYVRMTDTGAARGPNVT